jgi:hypothetical protein
VASQLGHAGEQCGVVGELPRFTGNVPGTIRPRGVPSRARFVVEGWRPRATSAPPGATAERWSERRSSRDAAAEGAACAAAARIRRLFRA